MTAKEPPPDGDTSPGDGGTWEDVAEDEDEPVITPEAEEEEPSSEEAPKVVKKKPETRREETKSKKEHVNVVFIGIISIKPNISYLHF